MVVGWQFATHMRRTLVLDALRMALGLRAAGADVALVHHSDRGSQYTSDDYTQTLDDHDVTRSLGSTGDCYDNALAESFVDSFKTELISDRGRTHDQAELAIVEWVGWFNHARLHSSLDDIPPAEYEQLHAGRISQSADQPDGWVATPAAAANGLRTRRVCTTGVLERPNDVHRPVPPSTPALTANLPAPNGSRATATAPPPMDMLTTIRVANIPTGATTNVRSDLKDKQRTGNQMTRLFYTNPHCLQC